MEVEKDITLEHMRIPPHSIEAEQAVLGGLMLCNQEESLGLDSIERLRPAVFYRLEHQVIYRAMMQLVKKGQPIDIITVSNHLNDMKQLYDMGGLDYLGELAQNTPSAANIGAYADVIWEMCLRRAVINAGTNMIESAFNIKGRTAAEVLDVAEQKIFNISQHSNKVVGPEDIQAISARTITQIETRMKNQGKVTGVETGFTDFDKMTTGLNPGELVIIAGRPSMGKTSFAMNIAEFASIKSGKTVLVFSMEMSGEDLAARMFSSIGRIDQNKLRTGNMGDPDLVRLSMAIETMSKAKLHIDSSASLSPMELRARSRRIAKECDIGLIVVDYLGLMHVPGHNKGRTEEISEISRSLKSLAKELKVPVIALSQLNRSLEVRPNKRPIMSDLRDSGAIEQDADLIAFVYRDEIYNEDSPDKGTAEIIIGKHRNGPTGTIRLTFVGHHTRFDNLVMGQERI
jgi:replicative DNA helicase